MVRLWCGLTNPHSPKTHVWVPAHLSPQNPLGTMCALCGHNVCTIDLIAYRHHVSGPLGTGPLHSLMPEASWLWVLCEASKQYLGCSWGIEWPPAGFICCVVCGATGCIVGLVCLWPAETMLFVECWAVHGPPRWRSTQNGLIRPSSWSSMPFQSSQQCQN